MRGYWKKRVPASVLAVVMLMSMMPAAMAAEHHWSGAWTKDESSHWHACTDAGCSARSDEAAHDFREISNTPATCYQEGRTVYRCTVCDYEQTVTSSATGQHVYDDRWTSDNDYHWHACTTNGCTATSGKESHVARGEGQVKDPTCTEAGQITYTCEICGKTYTRQGSPAMGHSYVNGKCTRCGASNTVSTSGQNISLDVTNSKTVGSTLRTEMNRLFKNATGSNMTRARFTNPSGTSYGRLYTDDDKTSLSSSSYYYYSSSSYGTYPMSGLYFVPGNSRGTYRVSYTAYDENGNTVSGTVSIYNGSSSGSGSTIKYTVKADGEVTFDADDFIDVYEDEYSDSPRWVEFSTDDTLSTSKGTLYFDYDGADEKTFSDSTIDHYRFYISRSKYGDYDLDDLSFVAGSSSRTVTLEYAVYGEDDEYVEGEVEIKVTGSSSSRGDITYEVAPGEEVRFDADDFDDYFQDEYGETLRWVEFYTDDTLDRSVGYIYYDYDGDDEERFDEDDLEDYSFYYSSSRYGDYALDDLSFVAGDDFEDDIVLEFTAYYDEDEYVDGAVVITSSEDTASSSKEGDITYEVAPGEEVRFDADDFDDYFQDEYDETLRWVEFYTDDSMSRSVGYVYYDYDGDDEERFDEETISDWRFYYQDEEDGDYDLDDLSFVAGDDFDEPITLEFSAYYDEDEYVEGELVIAPEGTFSAGQGDIFYYTTYNSNVQINANDIARFFEEEYPNDTLSYVRLGGAPSSGSLYYNYYSASSYGEKRERITSSNYRSFTLHYSPDSTDEYALSELTYIPSGFNYCATIPFTAYGSGSRSVSGTILISVSQKSTVSEVYGVTPRNGSVTFPAAAISMAVNAASGLSLDSIQLLQLPDRTVGTVYEGSGTSTRADTSTRYTYSSGSHRISQLRFVPASGYTGSVEIPYVAYRDGDAIASGVFSLGIVTSIKVFTDVSSSTWCYKYVTELSDADVIDGYQDGTFRPNNNVTYGQALKLIMLATGYQELAPTGSHPFSGYLSRAQRDGLVSGTVDLDAPITRLAVAQIAAKAMDLDTEDLSSVKPFTDTNDVYVQALNAAGIVEGYFSNGTSTYRPGNYLTRGQISAIVWRIQQAS